MKINCLISGVAGATKGEYGQGGIIAIISAIMVFVVLLVIILLTEAIGNAINKANPIKEGETETPRVNNNYNNQSALNLNDEDATVAALVASIDYRNETKRNIKVVSIREVK